MMMYAAPLFWVSSSLLILSSVDSATAQSSGDLRLVRGSFTSSSYTSGRLEIYLNGQWGTVCDHGWDSVSSSVACRQLGYSDTTSPFYRTSFRMLGFGSGSGQIWLDDVDCLGMESRLLSCSNRGIGSHNCVHSNDVAVYCTNTTGTSPGALHGDLRLTQGSISDPSFSSGRVEIYVNGQWGTVCDNTWYQEEADVTCRQLGYVRASSYGQADRNGFSAGTGEIWLDTVFCSPSDSTLLSCSHNAIGNHNCVHGMDVAVFCSSLSVGAVVGIVIGSLIGGLCLICTFSVILCICCVTLSSKQRTQRPSPPTAPYPTATVVTATASSYPSQPPPQPRTYPAQPTSYPTNGQEPPPPYPGQGFEMQPIFQPAAGPYPPQPQSAYPPQPQPAYPPQPQPAYPPAGYPEQTAPYPSDPTKATKPTYPTNPTQPPPYPTDLIQGYPMQQ